MVLPVPRRWPHFAATKLPTSLGYLSNALRIVKPTGQQQSAFEKLKQTSANVADQLRASCPAQIAESPVARLEEMQNRLNAMVQAVKALRPTLATFYASLSDEQKAQFNILGQNTGSGSGG
jgi:ABC-type transporter MlaC component